MYIIFVLVANYSFSQKHHPVTYFSNVFQERYCNAATPAETAGSIVQEKQVSVATVEVANKLHNRQKLLFIENVGQITNGSRHRQKHVAYTLKGNGLQVFVENNKIHYQFTKITAALSHEKKGKYLNGNKNQSINEPAITVTHRFTVSLAGANSRAAFKEQQASGYREYYYNEANPDGVAARSYEKIVIENVYNGIDWVLHTTETGLKYDFVVRPGVDPAQIKLRITDADAVSITPAGELLIKTQLGEVKEKAPVSFSNGKEVATRFVQRANGIIQFNCADYDVTQPLTIDPDLAWATYYGGSDHDKGYATVADNSGNIYITGSAASGTGIANGGHSNTYLGNVDAFLVKFNSAGVRQWATYYGGNGSEVGHGLSVDNAGNVYLVGETNSSTGIADDGHQNTIGGNSDAFLVKFNSEGVRQWATYYGGSNIEEGYALAVDINGNIYLGGQTYSSTGIADDGHQNTIGGNSDAFLVKFNSAGVRQWGTYYGGSQLDHGEALAVDIDGNVYLVGFSNSTTGIADNGHQITMGGIQDAFLVKFNSEGVRQWGTYYGGEVSDGGYALAVDNAGNAYIGGYTWSTTNISNGGHQNAIGGGSDAFLVKFNSEGVRQWATYYGGAGYDGGYDIAVDNAGNAFLCGYTYSTSNIAIGGYQNTFGGTIDAFLVKFNAAGVRQWATYYGGNGSEVGYGLSIDNAGNVNMCGETSSSTGIAVNGHQNIFGGNSDAFLVKFTTDAAADKCPVGSILYVDSSIAVGGDGSSWAKALKTLDSALVLAHLCPSVEKVLVAKGTYVPGHKPFDMQADKTGVERITNDNRDKTFHIRVGLEIYGGYAPNGADRNISAYPTVLNGALNATDSAYHVVIMDSSNYWASATDSTKIDGFIIKNGRANGSGYIGMTNVLYQNSGGAGYTLRGFNIWSNNIIIDNKAAFRGGAIDSESGYTLLENSLLVLRNNRFIRNTCSNIGGALFTTSKTLIDNNIFLENTAINNGGGVYGDSKSDIFQSNTFEGNIAASGGGVYLLSDSAILHKNIFENNNAPFQNTANYNYGHGGGLFIFTQSETNFLVDNCEFLNNRATADGGGLFIRTALSQGGVVKISNNLFNKNFANNGAGIATQSGSYTLEKNTFSQNSANGGGGGISSLSSNGMLISNIFSGNSAVVGGGVYFSEGKAVFLKNEIAKNLAESGAGVYTNSVTSDSLISNTIFENIASVSGGGIYIYGGINIIVNNVLAKNNAQNGGGIYTYTGINHITNNTIYENNASTFGGGYYSIGNTNTTNNLNNNIFWSNKKGSSAIVQGADFYRGSGNCIFKNNILQLASTNYTTVGSGNYDLGTAAANNKFAQDPLFVNAADIDGNDNVHRTADDGLKLQVASPAINAGDNNLLPAGINTDITGVIRVQEGTVDIGAYESTGTIVNQPPIANAGADSTLTLPKSTVTLIGNASNDPDGSIVSYLWAQVSGPNTAIIVDPSSATTGISGLIMGVYNFELTVTDNNGATAKDQVLVSVNTPTVVPGVSISANPGNIICAGTNVTFTATPVNGGNAPAYQWKKNGNNTGTNSNIYNDNSLANGDVISVVLTSNAPGSSPITAASNTITITINPALNFTTQPTGGSICAGSSRQLLVVATGSGILHYQWKKDEVNVGTDVATYTASAAGSYTVTVTDNCSTITSGTAIVTVTETVAPAVSISANPDNNICAGTHVTFTATPSNGGDLPVYQWKLNGTNVGANSATYSNNNLVNGDVVSVGLTSSLGCSSPATATSSITVTVNTILTPSVSIAANPGNSICAGSSVTFTAIPVNGGGAPSYQWKKNGNNAGTNSNTYNDNSLISGDVVTVVMTSNAGCANPATTTSNAISIIINPALTITTQPVGGSICAGSNRQLSVAATGSGTLHYQWKKDEVNIGTDATTYTATAAGSYTVTVTDNCNSITSNAAIVTVTETVIPSVNISANPGSTICAGTNVTFTATPQNGGETPTYQWKLNGTNVGTNSATYSNNQLANSDMVSVVLTSSSGCASPATATGNITITVNAVLSPSVSISANPGNSICAGSSVTFTATPVNGGVAPAYQWKKNGANVGSNSNTYIDNTLITGDAITVILTSNAGCASPATATSNAITMQVNNYVTPAVSISANPAGTICAGTTVTYSAIPQNGGATPAYQWKLNGNNVGSNSAVYSNSSLANGDVVSVVLTSSAGCTTTGTATSNSITTILGNAILPVVMVSDIVNDNCSGKKRITVNVTGGIAPYTYWLSGGTPQNTNSFDVVPGTYMVHVADATTCSGVVNATVTGPEKLEVTVTSTAASCANNTKGTITLTTTGGVQPYSYRLTGLAPQSSNVFTGLNKGSYLITVTDARGCTLMASATVVSDNNVNVVALQATANPVLCATGNGSVQLTALFTGGMGELSTSYEWYKDGSSSIYATTQNLTAVPAGTYQALIKVYDAGNPGCVNYYNAWAVVTQNNVSSATISGTVTVMQGAAAPEVKFTAIGGTAPYTYVYRVNNGAEQTVTGTTGSVTQSTSQAGVFTYTLVRVTDGGGCVLNVNGTAVVTVKADSTSANPPDLSIQLMVLPAIAHGPTVLTGIVKIFEINGVPTTGPVTVYISKEDKGILSFTGTATEVSGISVNNNLWSFDGNSHPSFYKFTTGAVIAGNGELSFGVSWLFTPGASAGKTNITAMILAESGGENRLSNNADSEGVDYFIN